MFTKVQYLLCIVLFIEPMKLHGAGLRRPRPQLSIENEWRLQLKQYSVQPGTENDSPRFNHIPFDSDNLPDLGEERYNSRRSQLEYPVERDAEPSSDRPELSPTPDEVADQSSDQGDQGGAGIGCGKHGKACTEFERRRRQRLESLKQDILEKLKLDAPPNITNHKLPKDSAPIRAMMRRYGLDERRQARLEELEMDGEIESEKVMSIAKSAPFQDRGEISDNWFYFNFTEEEYTFDVRSAFLWVHIRPRISTSLRQPLIDIRQYQQGANFTLSPSPMRQMRPVNITSRRGGFWHKVRVTEIVRNWFRNSSQNYGIQVISTRILNLIETGNTNETVELKPYLEVELISGHKRRKRSASGTLENCNARRNLDNPCCLYDLPVNFEEIGWDWIIYPTSYNAKYCSGECRFMQTTNMREKLVRQADLGQQQNCCVPKQLTFLSMLYYDKSANIVYSKVPEMQIRRCGCM